MNDLAELAERVEIAAMESLYAAGPEGGVPTTTSHEGGVRAFSLDGSQDFTMNRALGLGTRQAATRDGIAALLAWFAARRAGRYLVHVTPRAQPKEVGEWLVNAGLTPFRAWMKFARGRESITQPHTSLVVRNVGPELRDDFARIACDAFGLPTEARVLAGALCGRTNWHCFMSFMHETPAGIGALYVDDGVGWLGFGATLPEFRGRGGQAAVLAARLEAALDAGCRAVVTETGEAAPGDPQHSYKNILKAGFRELYLCRNFAGVRPTAPSSAD